MADGHDLDDVPLGVLRDAMHAAARGEAPLWDPVARAKARAEGRGRWVRVEAGAPVPLGEAEGDEPDAHWMKVG